MNKFFKIFFLIVSITEFSYSQGLINNGARIVFTGASQIYIDGATGNYSSTANGFITPSASSSITLLGNWTNNAGNNAFTADGGGVMLAGAAQTIGGTNASAFHNLSLTGTNTKQLAVNGTTVGGQAATFTGVLSLGTRPLNLNNNRLDITNPLTTAITQSGGYIISETNAAVNNSIVRWYMRTTGGAHIYPFGVLAGTQIPFTFNATAAMANAAGFIDVSTRATAANDNQPWAGASNVGAVSQMFCPNNLTTGNVCAAGSVIDRWWDITNSHPVTADITFSYLGSENTITNAPTGNIGAQFWDGAGWVLDNASFGSNVGVTAGVGSVLASGIATFCPWVLTSKLVPLPVELLDFKANCFEENKVKLNWVTASEINCSHYEILNSVDGINFSKIGSEIARGDRTANTSYSYIVNDKKSFGNYFKLRIVDKDYSARLSKIETVNADCDIKKSVPKLYFNDEVGITIVGNSDKLKNYSLAIADAAGRIVFKNDFNFTEGFNSVNLKPLLAKGVYLATLSNSAEGVVVSKKFPTFGN